MHAKPPDRAVLRASGALPLRARVRHTGCMKKRRIGRKKTAFARYLLAVPHNGYHPHLLRDRAVVVLAGALGIAELGFLAQVSARASVAPASVISSFIAAQPLLSERSVGIFLLGIFALMGVIVGLGLVTGARRFPLRAIAGGAFVAFFALALLLTDLNYFSGNFASSMYGVQTASVH